MKKGTQVKITRRNGERLVGRIAEVRIGARGAWFDVNVAEPRQPAILIAARAANIKAV